MNGKRFDGLLWIAACGLLAVAGCTKNSEPAPDTAVVKAISPRPAPPPTAEIKTFPTATPQVKTNPGATQFSPVPTVSESASSRAESKPIQADTKAPTAQANPSAANTARPAPPHPAPVVAASSDNGSAERLGAQKALALGARVTVQTVGGERKTIDNISQLPDESFHVVAINAYYKPQVTDDLMTVAASLKHLESLVVSDTGVTDVGIQRLENMPELRKLWFSNQQPENWGRITDVGVRCLATLPQLTDVSLSKTNVTDAGLIAVGQLKNMMQLDLYGCKLVTDAGLPHLTGLANLKELRIGGTQVSDAGLANLLALRSLESLDLRYSKLTGNGLSQLAILPSLSTLVLINAPISDEILAHVGTLKNLEKLYLNGTAVGDAGIAHLAKLDKLSQLVLTSTQVTDAGVAALQQALPKCKITR